ncbi:MAG: YwbE family protein [Chloroflexota bacterium]
MTEILYDGTKRSHIEIGQTVEIIQKQDQRTGKLTAGVVVRILTKSASHPHGIKVRLSSGEVGRVKHILAQSL